MRTPNWVDNAELLWTQRRILGRNSLIAAVISLGIAFALPKRYESTARIMPPENGSGGAAMLAALAGHAGGLGPLGGLAGSLLGGHNTSALFVDLLRSGTVSGHLIDRYDLQRAYGKRYRMDAAKYLARHTTIVDDKKSGVLTITVEDADPYRARDLASAYLEELNHIVTATSTSSARQERLFIERRLTAVHAELEQAQIELSNFSSTHATLDIKEQTHAMVDSAAKLQGMLFAGQSELGSLEQIYGDGNVRVRAAQARVSTLQRELTKMSGSDAPLTSATAEGTDLYPPLRQLPRLAVPYANLYRRVRIQETVYELLTQEYEAARIEEAKDTPAVNIIDTPGLPEKKSFPPRLIVAAALTLASALAMAVYVLLCDRWRQMDEADPRRLLMQRIFRQQELSHEADESIAKEDA